MSKRAAVDLGQVMPPELVVEIETITGPVASTRAAAGGFTPGLKYLLEDGNGRLYFVKSAVNGTWTADNYAQEAGVHSWLPESASGGLLLAHLTSGERQTLVFRGVRDRRPGADRWAGQAEVDLALRGLRRTFSELDAAAPADLPSSVHSFWAGQRFWRDCTAGTGEAPEGISPGLLATLADLEASVVAVLRRPEWAYQVSHEDLRRDQFLITEEGEATVIDWNFATRTPRIVDAVLMALHVAVSGLDAEAVIAGWPQEERYRADEVNAVLAAGSGYYLTASRATAGKPAGLVALQAQAAQAGIRWLRERLE